MTSLLCQPLTGFYNGSFLLFEFNLPPSLISAPFLSSLQPLSSSFSLSIQTFHWWLANKSHSSLSLLRLIRLWLKNPCHHAALGVQPNSDFLTWDHTKFWLSSRVFTQAGQEKRNICWTSPTFENVNNCFKYKKTKNI